MFALSLVDHLRLTFAHVIYSHRAHAQAALRHTSIDRWLKAGEALLLLATALSAVAFVSTREPSLAVTTAVTAVLAVATLIVRLALDLEHVASTHRTCSARLWQMREQYRALLSDLSDGAISPEVARDRRDALMASLNRIYEQAPPADREAYQSARQSIGTSDETVLSDEEIDRFLPRSLQKAGKA
jgi:hypothetical protein